MAYKIDFSCIECGECEKVCPKKAIYHGCGQFEIIGRICINCGRCAAVCPVGSPKPKKSLLAGRE